MRTTINLPDDVSDLVRAVADARGISLGAAVSELVRRGLNAPAQVSTEGGFPRFDVPAEAPPITLEQTLAAEEDL
jgi:hypothetical protein